MKEKLPKPLIISVLASLATGILTLLFLKKNADKNNNLARRAPQLDLNNPGSQDDFPKPPAISDIG